MNESALDATLYGGKKSEVLTALETYLKCRLDFVQNACGIDDAVTSKLRLAGQYDIKRFVDKIEIRKALYLAESDDVATAEIAQRDQVEFKQQRDALSGGLAPEGSLFAKTLNKVLTKDQQLAYRSQVRAARLARHRTAVDLVVTLFDMAVGFNDHQRQQLTHLLLRETRVPISEPRSGDELFGVIITQVVRLPEQTLRPICHARQWEVTRKLIAAIKDELAAEKMPELALEPEPAADMGPPDHGSTESPAKPNP